MSVRLCLVYLMPMRISRLWIAVMCVVLCTVPPHVFAQVSPEQRAQLQAQLDQINKEIDQNQTQLAGLQTQRTSYERDVAILDSKIHQAQLAIRGRELSIQQIKEGISDKQNGIKSLDVKTAAGQASIAQMLRETRTMDDISLVEITLSGSLSDLMQEQDDFGTIQKALGASFVKIATLRSDLTARKLALDDSLQEEQDLQQIQLLQNNSLKATEKEKQTLVSAAKGQEKSYKNVIADKQKTASQIKAALFALRDTKSVSFGALYSYAKEASATTGVRPAVILGILAEESNLGQNVGTGNWRVDMHPSRDAPLFAQLCTQLGIDPDTQPVSKKPWYGWGGAMGPAQFIPSTWVQYADRIGTMVGQTPANPWDPRTATFATALLMSDNGADKQSRTAERLAALRYLAGWKNASKAAYAFYGNDVMDLADKFQAQIDVLGS